MRQAFGPPEAFDGSRSTPLLIRSEERQREILATNATKNSFSDVVLARHARCNRSGRPGIISK